MFKMSELKKMIRLTSQDVEMFTNVISLIEIVELGADPLKSILLKQAKKSRRIAVIVREEHQ